MLQALMEQMGMISARYANYIDKKATARSFVN